MTTWLYPPAFVETFRCDYCDTDHIEDDLVEYERDRWACDACHRANDEEAAQLAEIDEQITQAELVALFGDRMPIEIAAALTKPGGYASRTDARKVVNAALRALADGDGT